MTDRVDDNLRAAVIDSIISGPAKEPIPEVKESNRQSEQPSSVPSETKLNPAYDLNDALQQVSEIKAKQSEAPTVTDGQRKACGTQMDKSLLREMMGHLRR